MELRAPGGRAALHQEWKERLEGGRNRSRRRCRADAGLLLIASGPLAHLTALKVLVLLDPYIRKRGGTEPSFL